MKMGYIHLSKTEVHEALDLQIDTLVNVGMKEKNIYKDVMSGKRNDDSGLKPFA